MLAYSLPFSLFLLAWIFVDLWWIALLDLLFLVLSIASLKRLIVLVTEENIVYPSLFNRKINWNEISNAVLKDDLLTLDFKNNKLVQQLVDESSPTINEKEFNDFCKSRLTI